MRGWLADKLLWTSTALFLGSVWCKDRAIDLLRSRGRSRRGRR